MTITATERDYLNKMGVGGAAKVELGSLVHRGLKVAKAWYKYSRDGGAVGDIDLYEIDGVTKCKIPTGALIVNAFVRVVSGTTSGGSATVAVKVESAADMLGATAYGDLDTADKVQGVPDWATLADSVLTTAERTVKITVATAALTAGEFYVYLVYLT